VHKAIHCDTKEHTFKRLTSIEELREARQDPNAVVWLDLLDPSDEDLARVEHGFQLHPLAIEDATHEHQRPKVDEYENFFFVVFYTAHYDQNKGQIDVQEIDMFLGRNYLVTVHEHPLSELDEVEQRWTRNAKQLTWGIGVLLYSLLDTIVDNYFPIVDSLVDHADDLEDRLYAGRTRNSHITLQILDLKKQFTRMRRIATPERDVLNVLTNRDNPLFDEHVLIYFRDIYDHITRLADTVDIYRDQLSSTMDANLAIVSNDLNKVMRTLTGASIILMADALIAGIYGMNFKNIPELELPWGYFACLGLMFALSVLLVLYFKRLKWL
jgi:magnesium transporter